MLPHKVFSLRWPLFCLASLMPMAAAQAAELGEGRVMSYIGQALRAEIELTGLTAAEEASLSVRPAAPETYRLAHIAPNPALASLNLSIEQRGGRRYILATSNTAVNAPYMHVFIALSSGNVSKVRAFTFWLAPPPAAAPKAGATASIEAKPQPKPASARTAQPTPALPRNEAPAAKPVVAKTAAIRAPEPIAGERGQGKPGADKAEHPAVAGAGSAASEAHPPAAAKPLQAATAPATASASAAATAKNAEHGTAAVTAHLDKPAPKSIDKPIDKRTDKAVDKPVDKAEKIGDKAVDKLVDKPVENVAAHVAHGPAAIGKADFKPPVAHPAGKPASNTCPAAPASRFSKDQLDECRVAQRENAIITAQLAVLEQKVSQLRRTIGVPADPGPAAADSAAKNSAANSTANSAANSAPSAVPAAAAHPASTAELAAELKTKVATLAGKHNPNAWIWQIALPAALAAIALLGGALWLLKRIKKNKQKGGGKDGAAPATKKAAGKAGPLSKLKQFFSKIGRRQKKAAKAQQKTAASEKPAAPPDPTDPE
jgi:hypothetical protein